MKSPPEDVRAGGEGVKPDFDSLEDPDELLKGERTRDDFLSVAMQLREPTSIAEIAEWAGRGEDSAREYMRWFESIGLVRRASDDPERYETNQSYLYWRRVDQIRTEYPDTEIVEHLQRVLDDLDQFRERYDAGQPNEIDLVPTAQERDVDVQEVWEDLSRWKTLLARRYLLEDALDREQDRYFDASDDDTDGSSKPKRPA